MNENVPLTNVTIGCCVCVYMCVFGARYDDEGYRNKKLFDHCGRHMAEFLLEKDSGGREENKLYNPIH